MRDAAFGDGSYGDAFSTQGGNCCVALCLAALTDGIYDLEAPGWVAVDSLDGALQQCADDAGTAMG